MLRPLRIGRLLLGVLLGAPGAVSAGLSPLWQGTWWGEPSGAVAAHFGARATILPRPIDFGDSYATVVLRDVVVGGVPLIAFFQIDKRTGGLRRIQLERQRHGVDPPAFRAILGALQAAYGPPEALCRFRPAPGNGYQAAAEGVWRHDGVLIRALYRDTTIEAFEGCLTGDLTAGPCGLTGQLLLRISPPAADRPICPVAAR